MKSALKALVLLPIVALVTLFAVANRAPVAIEIDPFGWMGSLPLVSVPLFVVIFAAVTVGVILGGTTVWVSQRRHRKAARLNAREAARLRSEAEQLRVEVRANAGSPDLLPSTIR